MSYTTSTPIVREDKNEDRRDTPCGLPFYIKKDPSDRFG